MNWKNICISLNFSIWHYWHCIRFAVALRRGRQETRITQWRQGNDIYLHNQPFRTYTLAIDIGIALIAVHVHVCSSNVTVCVQVKLFEISIIFNNCRENTCLLFVYIKTDTMTQQNSHLWSDDLFWLHIRICSNLQNAYAENIRWVVRIFNSIRKSSQKCYYRPDDIALN